MSIDYERLGRVADDSYCNPNHTLADLARAVVAALGEQRRAAGYVEVQGEDVRVVSLYLRNFYIPDSIRDAAERLAALVAAPEQGGERG